MNSKTIFKQRNATKNVIETNINQTSIPVEETEVVGMKDNQQVTAIRISLMGNPEMVDPNTSIKDQVRVLPYNKNREIPRSAFEPSDMLGSGNFGTVYKGMVKGLYGPKSETQVAMKTLNGSAGDSEYEDFLYEIKIMSNVNPHPNLVSLVGSCTSEIRKEGELWLIIEFCQFGDLKQYLIKNQKQILRGSNDDPINSRCLILWAYGICKGMNYLTKKGIMHGDLAARNVMLDENPLCIGGPVAKVADFGLSKNFDYENEEYEKSTRLMVPWKWMAYEYLIRGVFTLSSDVWSFAVVLWEILSFGNVPYGQSGFSETLEKLERGYRLPCPKEIKTIANWSPKTLYNGISKLCFTTDPNIRATFSDVIQIIEGQLSQDELTNYERMCDEYQLKSAKYLLLSSHGKSLMTSEKRKSSRFDFKFFKQQ